MTTPSGQQPVDERRDRQTGERYSPGLSLPEEPSVPSRHRPLSIALAIVVVLAVAGFLVNRFLLPGQDQDPALTPVEGDGQFQTEPAPADG